MAQPKMIRARGDGIEIQLADWPGAGEPILAVHGLTANCRSFDLVAAGLEGAHRLLAMDLRGRGLSDKPAEGYSIEHHCRDIEALLAELGLDRITLMGHSLGAYIGLAMAARRPDLVARLILLDGGAQLSPEEWAKIAAGIKPSLDRLGRVFPSFAAYLELVKQAPYLKPWNQAMEDYFRYETETIEDGVRSRIRPEAIAEERENLLTLDPSAFYPQVTCPVLILRATEGMLAGDDLVLPEGPTAELKKALPQARVVDFEGTNHFSLVLAPNARRDSAILEFMAG